MLTARGSWLLLITLALLALGIVSTAQRYFLLLTVGLALVLWFLFEWAAFVTRARFVAPRVRVTRQLSDGLRATDTIWAGQVLTVHLTLSLPPGSRLPLVHIADRLPEGCVLVAGHAETVTAIEPGQPLVLSYQVKCLVPGPLRFVGVHLHLADFQGFFSHAWCCREFRDLLVMPPIALDAGGRGGAKQHNLLPPPGIHRMRRPGSGSELLDLRDYRPGDPPKQIAWKASARRDRLITKEYESEVPVRCTLFVDTSSSVRLGPLGRTALTRLVHLASSVAQRALGDRDLVGLVLFDEADWQTLQPARGSRHLVTLLRRLAGVARLAPHAPNAKAAALLPLTHALASAVYPEIMHRAVNSTPWLLFWRPVLDSDSGRVVLGMLVGPLLVLALFWAWFGNSLFDIDLSAEAFSFLIVLFVGVPLLGGVWWLAHGLSGYLPAARRLRSERKRVSAVMALRNGSGPGGLGLLLDDDAAFADAAQRFLAEHQQSYPVPMLDAAGRYQFRCVEKVTMLAHALMHAIGRAHDNELFVILADLIELDNDLDPLLNAVRVALARHHAVLVVCPWPASVPPPSDAADEPLNESAWSLLRDPPGEATSRENRERLMRDASIARYHQAFRMLRRALVRLGVPVIRAEAADSEQRILERLDRLRQAVRR